MKKLKHVVQYASFAAYHLSLETSFLADEGASLPPKFPIVPSIELPKKLIEADQFHSTVSSVTSPDKSVSNNHQNDRTGIKLDIERLSLSLDIIHSNKELLENISDPQKSNSLFELTSISDINEFSNQCPEGTAFKSSPYVFICGPSGPKTGFSAKEPTCISPLSNHPSNHQGAMLEQSVKERSKDSNDRLLRPEDEHNKSDIALENEVPGNYFSTADNHQSILVSLSSTCIRKSRVCERSQLFRIKFYGSFDKPLGRYLRDHLFDKVSNLAEGICRTLLYVCLFSHLLMFAASLFMIRHIVVRLVKSQQKPMLVVILTNMAALPSWSDDFLL